MKSMTAFIDTNTYCQMGLLVAVIVSGFVLVAVAAVAEDMVQFSSVDSERGGSGEN